MMDWLKNFTPIISLLLLVVPFQIIKGMNLKKQVRWIQERFVRYAFLYVLLICGFFWQINDLLLRLLKSYLNTIAPFSMVDYTIKLFDVIILNAVILIVFAIVKRIAKIGTGKVIEPSDWTNEGLANIDKFKKYYWAVLNFVYHLDDHTYSLRINWVKVKHTIKYCVRILGVIYVLTVIFLEVPFIYNANWLPIDLMGKILSAAYIWPTLSLLVVAEFAYFLDGNEQDEDDREIVKEKSSNITEVDYSKLEEEYKKIYKGRYIGTLEIHEKLEKNLKSDYITNDPVIEGIKRKLIENNLEINYSFIRHIEKIAAGQDVIIDSTIYSEFGEYLYRYLNVVLARGETVLFICPDEQQMELMHRYTEERLKLINGYSSIWEMKSLSEQNGTGLQDIDILFATLEFVRKEKVFVGFDSFFAKLSTVIITNATEIMTKDNIPLSLLGFKLANILTERIQYICLSQSIPPDIRKAIVEALQLPDNLTAGDAYQHSNNTKIMFWRYEDLTKERVQAQDAIFPFKAAAYWGFELPLASVALKYGVDMISVISRTETPYAQILDSMKGTQQNLNKYFDNEQVDLDEQIAFNRCNKDNRYARFAIIDDECFNLPMAIHNSGCFGGTKATMVHIISKPYMLRDFYYANIKTYLNNESSINMFMPTVADTKRLAVFRLLYELKKNGLSENEIQERVSKWMTLPDDKTFSDRTMFALRNCLQVALRREQVDYVYNYFEFKRTVQFKADLNDGCFEECYIVYLKNNDVIKDLLALNKLAILKIRGHEFHANFFADGILQRYLVDQYMIFNGYSYRIYDIDVNNGIIFLTSGPGNVDIPSGYTQIRSYSVDNTAFKEITAPRTRRFGSVLNAMEESFTITHYKMPVKVSTSGYFTHLKTGEPPNFSEKPQIDGEKDYVMQRKAERKYESASVLSLKFSYNLSANTDKAAFLLAVIMNEFFKTWFPYSYSCVAVCPILNNSDTIYSDEFGKYIAKLYPQLELAQKSTESNSIELYIIEDSKTDLGIVQTLIDSWQELFGRMFDNIREYLNWQQTYEEQGDSNITKRYLYFGKDSEPECFDFQMLTKMFNELA